MLHSYPSIYNVGHKEAYALFHDPVLVEEKIDGSQFSFGVIDGELMARSKGKQLVLDAPEKMFATAVEVIHELEPDLRDGWTYRGEYLQKPKHNTIAYDRVPAKHIILFDVDRGDQDYLDVDEKRTEAGRLGLEVVKALYEGPIRSPEAVKDLLAATSMLGGAQPEGVVIKNYHRYGPDKKVLMGKYVTERFREQHAANWKATNPGKGDVVDRIIAVYRTDARWAKAVQHLRDGGELTETPKDIGPLMKEVNVDVLKECRDEMAAKLFEWAWPQISRGIVAGLPQWYKDRLLADAFVPPAEGEDIRCEEEAA